MAGLDGNATSEGGELSLARIILDGPCFPYELLELIYGYVLADCRDAMRAPSTTNQRYDDDEINLPWREFYGYPPPPSLTSPPSPLCTLSRLSRVSKALRQDLCPMLYESMTLQSKHEIPSLLAWGIPSGWGMTRFLYLDEVTFDQLKAYQLSARNRSPNNVDVEDLRISLPQLSLVCVYKPMKSTSMTPGRRDLHVELYDVFHWEGLSRRCSSSRIEEEDDIEARKATALFDVLCAGEGAYPSPGWNSIESLICRAGAGIVPHSERALDYCRDESDEFSLTIVDPFVGENVTNTLDLIFECLECTWWREFCRNRTDSYFKFNLTCHPAVLRTVIERFRARQPMFIEFDITLFGHETTEADMVELVDAFSEAFAIGWQEYRNGVTRDFVTIRDESVEEVWTDGRYCEQTKRIVGRLSKGKKRDPLPVPSFRSFHATVGSSFGITDEGLLDTRDFYLRTYPADYLRTRAQWL